MSAGGAREGGTSGAASSRGPSPDLRARVLAEIARTPAPTRRAHERRALAVAVGGALATAVLFAASGVERGTRPAELVAFTAGTGALAAVVLTRVSARAGGSMLGRPAGVLVSAVTIAVGALALAAIVAAALFPEQGSEVVVARANVTCAALTLVQGAVPFVTLVLPRRDGDPVHPAITGAALGATAGAWAATLAYLRCPHAAAFHCLAAHVAPVAVLAAVGAIVGRRLLWESGPSR